MDMVCKQIGIYSAPKKNIENNNDRSAWILKILKTPSVIILTAGPSL